MRYLELPKVYDVMYLDKHQELHSAFMVHESLAKTNFPGNFYVSNVKRELAKIIPAGTTTWVGVVQQALHIQLFHLTYLHLYGFEQTSECDILSKFRHFVEISFHDYDKLSEANIDGLELKGVATLMDRKADTAIYGHITFNHFRDKHGRTYIVDDHKDSFLHHHYSYMSPDNYIFNLAMTDSIAGLLEEAILDIKFKDRKLITYSEVIPTITDLCEDKVEQKFFFDWVDMYPPSVRQSFVTEYKLLLHEIFHGQTDEKKSFRNLLLELVLPYLADDYTLHS